MITKISLLATALCISSALAEDYEVKKQLFEKSTEVKALALPVNASQISIEPKAWAEHVVKKVVAQGTKVKKGDQVIWIDTKKVDEYLADQALARKTDEVRLAQAQQQLAVTKVKTSDSLKAAKLKMDRENADYKYFLEVTKADLYELTKFDGERANWTLESVEEELKQLLIMYKADGLTEATEEIIVHRARNAVKLAKLSTRQKQKQVKLSLEVGIPRKLADRKTAHERAVKAWEFAQITIPRALELKELEVQKLVNDDKKKAEKLLKVKADRAAMDIKAPADGYFYYGEFVNNSWSRSTAQKALVFGGKLPSKRVLATIVPVGNATKLGVAVSHEQASQLRVGAKGVLKLASEPWQRFGAEVKNVSPTINLTGKWDVVINTKVGDKSALAVGETASVNFVTYSKEDALVIPTKSIKSNKDGTFSVQLKMADDKQVKTTITLGENSGGKVEVLSGLKEGQVIVFDAKKK